MKQLKASLVFVLFTTLQNISTDFNSRNLLFVLQAKGKRNKQDFYIDCLNLNHLLINRKVMNDTYFKLIITLFVTNSKLFLQTFSSYFNLQVFEICIT